MMSLPWSRATVIRLYKDLMRKGNQLEFTDQHFYWTRIKKEFHKNKEVQTAEEKAFYLNVNRIFEFLCKSLNYLFSILIHFFHLKFCILL